MFSQASEVRRFGDLLGETQSRSKADFSQDAIAAHSGLTELFLRAGLNSSEQRRYIVISILLAAGFLLIWLLSQLTVFLAFAIGSILVRYQSLVQRANKRLVLFERDYTAFLLSLASSVKTGLDPIVGVTQVRLLFPNVSILRQELEKLNEIIESGGSEENAIRAFGKNINHSDLPLFRTAFLLARREGASLANVLTRLARVTRQRQSFRRKMRSALAMQKLSAIGIGFCAVAIGLIQFTTNREAVFSALSDKFGSKIILAGLCMMLFGIVWMFRLAQKKEV